MTSRAIASDLQVLGATVNNIVDDFDAFPLLAGDILNSVGIGKIDAMGTFRLDKGAWYSMSAYLRAYSRIERELGPTFLYKTGLVIPRNAIFPKEIHDLESGMRSIDVAYHMNHARGGEALFDARTGAMSEGIGHYHVQRTGDGLLQVVCENPYPCDFDRGIVEAMAKRFEPSARIFHATKPACRKAGGPSCTFHVEW
jgi:hypothetical protein